MICYLNRSTVDYDVRLNKYVQACKATNTPYFVIGWDRLLNAKYVDENEYQMKQYSPYANGRKFWPLVKWLCFTWFHLIKNFNKYKVIHACNMENTILSLPFKLLGKKVVFDVYDSQIIPVERKLIKVADCLILPAEKRLEQIGIHKEEAKLFLEIENVPTFDVSLRACEGLKREKIHLSYVGVFQKNVRGIENLVQMVLEDDRFVLDIAGAGDDLEDLIKDAANRCNRIHFHGKVQYFQALEIMNNSDYIVALYYPFGSNHTYASPNKSYEALFLSTPIITSLETLVGNKVIESNTGYVVGHTIDELKSVFEGSDTEDYKKAYYKKCQNCHDLWEKSYATYKKQVLEGIYIETLKSL